MTASSNEFALLHGGSLIFGVIAYDFEKLVHQGQYATWYAIRQKYYENGYVH